MLAEPPSTYLHLCCPPLPPPRPRPRPPPRRRPRPGLRCLSACSLSHVSTSSSYSSIVMHTFSRNSTGVNAAMLETAYCPPLGRASAAAAPAARVSPAALQVASHIMSAALVSGKCSTRKRSVGRNLRSTLKPNSVVRLMSARRPRAWPQPPPPGTSPDEV